MALFLIEVACGWNLVHSASRKRTRQLLVEKSASSASGALLKGVAFHATYLHSSSSNPTVRLTFLTAECAQSQEDLTDGGDLSPRKNSLPVSIARTRTLSA